MQLFAGMTDTEIEELLQRLTAFAAGLLRRAIWRGSIRNSPPGGVEAQDVVFDVVVKYEDGRRKINPTVSLVANLVGGVRSSVDALVQRKENLSEVRNEPNSQEPSSERADPEASAIYSDLTTQILDCLLERVIENDELVAVFALMEQNGIYTASELQETLGIDSNASKALRRRFSRQLDLAIATVVGGSSD